MARTKPYKTIVIPDGTLDPNVTNVIFLPTHLKGRPTVYAQANSNVIGSRFAQPTLQSSSLVSIKSPEPSGDRLDCVPEPQVNYKTIPQQQPYHPRPCQDLCGAKSTVPVKKHMKKRREHTFEEDDEEEDAVRRHRHRKRRYERIERRKKDVENKEDIECKDRRSCGEKQMSRVNKTKRQVESDRSSSSESSDTSSVDSGRRVSASRRRVGLPQQSAYNTTQYPSTPQYQMRPQRVQLPAMPSGGCGGSSCGGGGLQPLPIFPPGPPPLNVLPQPYPGAPPYPQYPNPQAQWASSFQYNVPANLPPVGMPQVGMGPVAQQMMPQTHLVVLPKQTKNFQECGAAAGCGSSLHQFHVTGMPSTVIPFGPNKYLLARTLPNGSVLYQGLFKVKK